MMAKGLFAHGVGGDDVEVLCQCVCVSICPCVCPLSLAHIQRLSAHQACFPLCRAAYPALQNPGNYSSAKQKTGVRFGQLASPFSGLRLMKLHLL